MNELTTFFILAFSSLFTLVNPIGLSPVFLSMVEHCNDNEKQQIALKGVFTALVVLIIFTFLGRLVFSFFGITVSGFKIAGGILFFRTGIQMLESRVPEPALLPKRKLRLKRRRIWLIPLLGFPLLLVPVLFHQ